MRLELQAEIAFPEVAVPAVVIPSNHDDRHLSAEPGEGGRHVESVAWNYTRVGKPEVEKVPVDEQAVAQRGDGFEKLKQRLLGRRWSHAEVGIRDDDKGMAQHGAKDGPAPPWPQPER